MAKVPANGPIPITTMQINTQTRSGIERNTFSARRAAQKMLQRRPRSEIDRTSSEPGWARTKLEVAELPEGHRSRSLVTYPKSKSPAFAAPTAPGQTQNLSQGRAETSRYKTATCCRGHARHQNALE